MDIFEILQKAYVDYEVTDNGNEIVINTSVCLSLRLYQQLQNVAVCKVIFKVNDVEIRNETEISLDCAQGHELDQLAAKYGIIRSVAPIAGLAGFGVELETDVQLRERVRQVIDEEVTPSYPVNLNIYGTGHYILPEEQTHRSVRLTGGGGGGGSDFQRVLDRGGMKIDGMAVYGGHSQKKCECGAEKAKVSGHSTWCPKYET